MILLDKIKFYNTFMSVIMISYLKQYLKVNFQFFKMQMMPKNFINL